MAALFSSCKSFFRHKPRLMDLNVPPFWRIWFSLRKTYKLMEKLVGYSMFSTGGFTYILDQKSLK